MLNRITLSFTFLFLIGWNALSAQSRPENPPITGLSGISIALDPGHSRTENMGIYNYSEAEKVLLTAQMMHEMFMTLTDVDTVILTRNNGTVEVGLTQRSIIANNAGVDMFHSLHSDAGPPSRRTTLFLYGSLLNGSEKTPRGGKDLGEKMEVTLTDAMRTTTTGTIGDRQFYGGTNNAPYLSVNRNTNMASILSEAGFHTNPTQNVLNMNDDFVRIQAQSYFLAFLDHYGIDRHNFEVFNGIIYDYDTGLPLDGALIRAGSLEYTTDTYESRFINFIGGDLSEGVARTLSNGYYFFEDAGTDSLKLLASKEGYIADSAWVQPDTNFFAFKDFTLVSDVPSTILRASFDRSEGVTGVDLDEELTISFSKRMNRESVENNIDITPAALLNFEWANDLTLQITFGELEFETSYTLSIDSAATDDRGLYNLDGNGDGIDGDGYDFTFITRTPDLEPPQIVSESPETDENGFIRTLNPVISLGYDEPIAVGLTSSRFNFRDENNAAVAWNLNRYDINNRSILNFFPQSALEPTTTYTLTVNPGLGDKYDNRVLTPYELSFRTANITSSPRVIDNFDAGVSNWWEIQQSGSTEGIISTATSRGVETQIVNRLFSTGGALRMTFAWTEGANSYLIRQYLGGGAPRSVQIPSNARIEAYVFGDGSNNLIRFVVRDGNGELEASEWKRINWLGWRHIYWDLAEDDVVAWVNGNGVVNGNSIIDSFQLTRDAETSNDVSTIYIDDLRYDRIVITSNPDELADELPSETALESNYPNPFNPSTTFRFRLAEAGTTQLFVYDMTGRLVSRVVDRPMSAGAHQVNWDAGNLSSGSYLYRLVHNGQTVDTKMLTLIK